MRKYENEKMMQSANLRVKNSLLLFSAITFFSLNSVAQCVTFPNPPQSGKTISAFIPKGWVVLDSASGDFNNDQLEDMVLVVANTKDEEANEGCNRTLIILQKTAGGYSFSAMSREAVLCKSCGGIFGDPYASISLSKNVLRVSDYGGSAWRWGNDYTFRFQQGAWYLIGVRNFSFWVMGDCEYVDSAAANEEDINFSTSKMHIVHTKENACKPYVDKWVTFTKKPLVSLNNFSVDKNYSPLKK